MPRLFISLEIPADIAFQLSMLRGGLNGAKWIDMEYYHLTLRYIGDIECHVADEVVYALNEVSKSPFELRITGLDVFGGKKPRALFACVAMTAELHDLQSDLERRMQRIGLKPDGRKFVPHITLARLKGTKPHEAAHYLSTRGGLFTRPFQVERFVLLSSKNSVGGGPYLQEETYDLTASKVYQQTVA